MIFGLLIALAASSVVLRGAGAPELATQSGGQMRLAIVTELGTIEVDLEPAKAPITVANFLRYMDAAYYDGGRFHRTVKHNPDNQPNNTVKIEVIQAGPKVDASVPPAERKSPFPPITLERTSVSGILHKDGVISMTRLGPDTATGDFFICVGDQPELDFAGKRNPDGQGFAAFGRVVKGMDVVRKIHQAPVEAQRLTPPVKIISIRRRAAPTT
jgi:peptidyl-prolyl cis-trans isomerase A (cyclophilin A)